jgi:hypothetical protein
VSSLGQSWNNNYLISRQWRFPKPVAHVGAKAFAGSAKVALQATVMSRQSHSLQARRRLELKSVNPHNAEYQPRSGVNGLTMLMG